VSILFLEWNPRRRDEEDTEKEERKRADPHLEGKSVDAGKVFANSATTLEEVRERKGVDNLVGEGRAFRLWESS